MIDLIRAGVTAALARDELALPAPLAAEIRPFLEGLVEAVAFAIRASKDPRAGRAITFANGQILHYLLDDQDLLPEATYGALGLLDDALLVHHHAAQLLVWYPWLDGVATPYEVPAPRAFALVSTLLPAGIADALERTARSVLTVATSLIGTSSDRPPPPPSVPVLRIDEAVALLEASS